MSTIRVSTMLGMMVALCVDVGAIGLQPSTATAWEDYVSQAEARGARELSSPQGFLILDFSSDAAAERRDLLSGSIVVHRMATTDREGHELSIPSALVHHWRGAIYLPGATLARVMADLRAVAPPPGDDVLASKVLERSSDRLRVYLRIRRAAIVTVVYNTEHAVTFGPQSRERATSRSEAMKIAEVTNPGTPQERELTPGSDRGFLWRLNAYWRYEQVAGGVIAECETISLSRSVPVFVRSFASPLVDRVARESLERTLVSMRTRFSPGASVVAATALR